jgi:hypothetical protein
MTISFWDLFQFFCFLTRKCEASEKCLERLSELERQARRLAKQLRTPHRHPEIDRDALENIEKIIEELFVKAGRLRIKSPVLQEKLSTSLKILRRLDCNESAADDPSFIATDFLNSWGITDEKPITFQAVEAAKQFLSGSIVRRLWMRMTRQS